MIVVSEEPGTGIGARCAGTRGRTPGRRRSGRGRRPRTCASGTHEVALWSVSTSQADADFDRAVLVGEAYGRWLWIVLRPASALLLLQDDWILRDVSAFGPAVVEIPFGGPPPAW